MHDGGAGEISGAQRQVFFPGKNAPPWLLWTAANGAVMLAVPAVAASLAGTAGRQALAAVIYPSTLALLALAQGLALARWFPRPRRWIAATLAGGAAAWFFGLVGMSVLDPLGLDETVLVVAVHGVGAATIAASQAAAVRPRIDRAAGLWIMACAAFAAVFAGLFLPFWADAGFPGYAGDEFAGSRELTTILRVVGACGIATAPAFARLVRSAAAR